MATRLESDVKEVRLSTRLTTSPACIVADTDDVTPALARMLKSMGQELPPSKRILELNPTHPLVVGLRQARADGRDEDRLGETAELLLGTAVLAEGGELTDPARFAKLLADRLERTL
jgi:molecular chaperone HtpG